MKNYYLAPTIFTRVNEEWINNSIDCAPLKCRYTNPLIQGLPTNSDFQPNFYESIALDIVSETVYNYPYPYITEKTFRPISCKKLFIIIGAPGILTLLQDYGFDVFSDIVDSTYDKIIDPIKRWKKLEEIIKEFTALPIEEIRNIVGSLDSRLTKNFQTLKNLEQIEINKIQ